MTTRFSKENCTAIVPVRAGSRGLPGKNIRNFAGRMLYESAVEQAQAFASTCIVSTDIQEILENGPQPGYELLPRSPELSRDDTPMAPVILDVLERCNLSGTIILLQATSPLRESRDIAAAIDLFANGEFDLVMSVTDTSSAPLKYGFINNDKFEPVADPEYCFLNRQELPPLKRPNGAVFVFGADWFRKRGSFATDAIGAIEMPSERSLDIDTIADFQMAETTYVRNGNSALSTNKKAV